MNVSVQSCAPWTLSAVVLSQDLSLEEVPGGEEARSGTGLDREAAPRRVVERACEA